MESQDILGIGGGFMPFLIFLILILLVLGSNTKY